MEGPLVVCPSWVKRPRPLFLCEEKPLDAGGSRDRVWSWTRFTAGGAQSRVTTSAGGRSPSFLEEDLSCELCISASTTLFCSFLLFFDFKVGYLRAFCVGAHRYPHSSYLVHVRFHNIHCSSSNHLPVCECWVVSISPPSETTLC